VPPEPEIPHALIDPSVSLMEADGSIKVWGDSGSGGTDAPAGSGYTKIYSNIS
jgi:hypothetical protein